MYRLLSHFFLLAAVALLGLAAYEYYAPAPGPALEVEQTDVEVPDLVAAKDTTVVFQLDNRSGPMRVLGVSGC